MKQTLITRVGAPLSSRTALWSPSRNVCRFRPHRHWQRGLAFDFLHQRAAASDEHRPGEPASADIIEGHPISPPVKEIQASQDGSDLAPEASAVVSITVEEQGSSPAIDQHVESRSAEAPSPSSSEIENESSSPRESKIKLNDEEKDPALEAAEAALRGFVGAASEVLKLVVLLPLRYLVLAPLGWALTRLGVLAVNANEVLDRLEAANKASPMDPARLAIVLRSLNRHHPQAVIDFVESRCLLSEPPPVEEKAGSNKLSPSDTPTVSGAGKFAVDAAVIKEYLVALVRSGRLKEFGSDGDAPPLAGRSHRSLPRLLEELQAASRGKPLTASPGASVAWPLHIVVQGGSLSGTSGQSSGMMATLQSWFWFILTPVLLAFAWVIGAATVKRYSSGGGVPAGAVAAPGIAATSNGGGGLFSQPKEYSKENIPEKSVKSFKDVKGCDEAIMELQEIVAYLKNPDKFTRLGGKLPKGVLLTGPPGTGKTLLARAVAGEAGVPFFYKAGSEFDEMFVGVGSRRVRSLFAAAKKKAPCIVFIDEIDAVGGKRTTWEASGGSRKTLNQLLTDMDGFEENSGVVVIAATNLPELLDSALTRPGRFDRQVAVALPDVRGRQQILELYLEGKPVSADVDVDSLARRTPGFSGAQLANMVNEAALLAARNDEDAISAALLDEARDKVIMGSPRALIQSLEGRRLTAYHEGGHALVALYTPGAKPIHKATIVPRGHALGMVSQLPDKDEYSTTRQQMVAHIDVCMGGKAAEELIFGADYVTSGATSDLKTATRLARHMVEDCGMSDRIGPMAFEESTNAVGVDTRKAADEEVTKILKDAYGRVATLLKSKETELHKLASALLEKETLTQLEIKELLWGPQDRSATSAATTQEKSIGASIGAFVPLNGSEVATPTATK